MTPTNNQIVAEASRRFDENPGIESLSLIHFIIEVTREGWTPPEPVDPDVLAYWDWHKSVNPSGQLILDVCDAYLAGARMAREEEQERLAKVFLEYVEHATGANAIIAREAVLDQLVSDAQAQGMGYSKEAIQ